MENITSYKYCYGIITKLKHTTNNVKDYTHLPTRLRHMSIQRGTNTTSQDQLMKASSFNAKNMNWSIFTAQKSSS